MTEKAVGSLLKFDATQLYGSDKPTGRSARMEGYLQI